MRAGHEPLGGGVFTVPYPRRELAPTLEAIDDAVPDEVHPEPDRSVHRRTDPWRGRLQPPAAGFLAALRKICDEHGILLIADEVQCGFARSRSDVGG